MADRILVVDDDEEMVSMLETLLTQRGYVVEMAARAEEAVELLAQRDVDTVLTDLKLDGDSGLDLCRRIAQLRPGIPTIVITAFGSMESAVAAIRAGAYDFINKPIDLETLALSVRRAVQHHKLSAEVERLREGARRPEHHGTILGESAAMKKVYDLIDRVADSEASILITGESGTGKELVARALHDTSRRAEGPFVAINCAAISAQLLESELFGHVRGAFTDAKQSRQGLFVESSGGSLFLDEIGEMPLEMQTKLLRALQERRVRPVGGYEEIFDTRVVTATNIDIDAAVDRGAFREDLFYRINVVRIRVPPLRARGNDILVMAQHFLEHFAALNHKDVRGILPDAARKLLEYDWPGNVRELQNVVERAVTLTRFTQITIEDLPDKIRTHQAEQLIVAADDPEHLPTLEELERRYVDRVLKATSGNKTQAAKILGLDRRTLYRKLERFERDE